MDGREEDLREILGILVGAEVEGFRKRTLDRLKGFEKKREDIEDEEEKWRKVSKRPRLSSNRFRSISKFIQHQPDLR